MQRYSGCICYLRYNVAHQIKYTRLELPGTDIIFIVVYVCIYTGIGTQGLVLLPRSPRAGGVQQQQKRRPPPSHTFVWTVKKIGACGVVCRRDRVCGTPSVGIASLVVYHISSGTKASGRRLVDGDGIYTAHTTSLEAFVDHQRIINTHVVRRTYSTHEPTSIIPGELNVSVSIVEMHVPSLKCTFPQKCGQWHAQPTITPRVGFTRYRTRHLGGAIYIRSPRWANGSLESCCY